jgi:hypothetical protein
VPEIIDEERVYRLLGILEEATKNWGRKTHMLERPQGVAAVFPPDNPIYQELTAIEKAVRYDNDVKVLKLYILDLEEKIEQHERELPKDAKTFQKALEDISTIVHETIGFPVAVG